MKKIIVLLFIPVFLKAAVICVDDNNLTSTQNGSSQYPFKGIQSAIDNAIDFDTIKVASGNYNRIENHGKSLFILGGFTGAPTSSYNSGSGGNFNSRTANPSLSIINAGKDSIGVNLTRFDFNPFRFLFDNFSVKNCLRGLVCDAMVSWPHVDNLTISNNIIENNGQAGQTSGGGIFISGNHHQILNNIIRNNHGGRGAGIAGNREQDTLLIEGNLIENNTGYDDHCGGIYLGGYVIIRHNIITGNRLQNTYGWGGGVLILGTAYMSYNIIKNNFCPSYGGAVFVDEGGLAYMDHELIYHNNTSQFGAAIAVDYGAPGSSYVYMTNCTIVNNYSRNSNGGNAIYLDVNSYGEMKNCIVSRNNDDFFVGSGSNLKVTYTLSDESYPGIGNFKADPLFADTLNEDFHLKSTGGRYHPGSQTWVKDGIHSPAIDAGDLNSPYQNEPTPNGQRINLGCYGNTLLASKSSSTTDVINNNQNELSVTLYPNPFRQNCQFAFTNDIKGPVRLRIYNSNGDFVMEIFGPVMNSGIQTIEIKGDLLSTGIYIYELITDKRITKGKMIML